MILELYINEFVDLIYCITKKSNTRKKARIEEVKLNKLKLGKILIFFS